MGTSTGRVVVVGAGLMGVGIAQIFALSGYDATLVETCQDTLDEALPRLRGQLETMLAHGLVTETVAEDAVRHVSAIADLAVACAEPGSQPPFAVLEAISEDLGAKQQLFRQLERLVPPSTLLWTNTSGLSVTAIAQDLTHPERVCGAHFWNPPHLIPLVEVVCSERTDEQTVTTTAGLLRSLGKQPVVVRRDVPGFIGNRLQHALQREAMALVAQGVASAEDVDLVVTQGFGRRLGVVGPLAICDLAGLDLVLDVDSYLLRDLENTPAPSPLLEELVARGDLGVKTGRGFHKWTAESANTTRARRDRALIEALVRDQL